MSGSRKTLLYDWLVVGCVGFFWPAKVVFEFDNEGYVTQMPEVGTDVGSYRPPSRRLGVESQPRAVCASMPCHTLKVADCRAARSPNAQ